MSSSKYPTRQEIIDRMETIDVFDCIAPLNLWKDEYYTAMWRGKTVEQKVDALRVMVNRIYYERFIPGTDHPIMSVKLANRYAFHVETCTIIMDKKRASIISALHELGHALYGESELEACAFSIKLFAKVFPTEYSKLEWHGHMLKLAPRQ